MKQTDPIAQILEAAIAQQGSLYRVAKETGVNYTTAHKWKTGKAHPQGRNLMKLIELAGKKVAGLVIVALILSGAATSNVEANQVNGLGTSKTCQEYVLCEVFCSVYCLVEVELFRNLKYMSNLFEYFSLFKDE